MEDKSQAWYSLLEDSSPWNNTSSGTQPTNFSDQAASTFLSSAIHNRSPPRLSGALANNYGQILSPIHHTSVTAITATTPFITPSKVTDSLTQYSISGSNLTTNTTHKSYDAALQSNQKCANALQANEKPRLPIFSELLNQKTSNSFKQQSGLHSQQTKDIHSTPFERLGESRKKAGSPGPLVFPFPSDRNFHLPSNKQKRTFVPSLASASTHTNETPGVQSSLNISPTLRKSFPDLFNPSLSVRAEPAGRDIAQSLNIPQPSSALNLTDNKENKGPDLNEGHDNVVSPNSDIMNSVIIESAAKEQVRYKKTPKRSIRHEDLGALSVSSEEEMGTVSSKATGYASTLSTLLDYMSIDERIKLLPPSTLKTSVVPDPGGLSSDGDGGGGSRATSNSSTTLRQKELSNYGNNKHLPTEERPDLRALAGPPVNWNAPEMEDSMMPPVGNRDNFIPVGSESNIQTIGRSSRLYRGVAVGGGGVGGGGSSGFSLGKQLDANIHITISKASCVSDVDIDTLLPMEERERFLPTGADSESLDKATSSSGSNTSDAEDNVRGCYQVNSVPDPVLPASANLPIESVTAPPHQLREPSVTGSAGANLEVAAAAAAAAAPEVDNNSDQANAEDYMDVVERQKYIQTDLRVSFEAGKDLPKNKDSSTGQESSHFEFHKDQDKTNIAKSEPDLLLGHSSNFGICGPDLHQSIACGEGFHFKENGSLSSRKQDLDSVTSEMPPSRTLQDFANHTSPILLPVQPLSLGDFTCPIEEEEDDTDELIKMVSSVLIEPQGESSFNKSDQTPAKQSEFNSASGNGDLSSTPSDNTHLSQTNLNDNVSTATSNQLTESGRGTLGSSEVSNSPLNPDDNSKTEGSLNSHNQDTSSKNQHSSCDPNMINSTAENAAENAAENDGEVQSLNTAPSHESLQISDKYSESQTDNSVKNSSLYPPDTENSSVSTDLYLPLSTMKGSVDNMTASNPSSARSYDNDQSQDSDVLGRQVNSLLCRTAYLEYRNQNAHTSATKNKINEIGPAPMGATYLTPSPEPSKFGISPRSSKSSYTEKEGLNYNQLQQDLTDLQNGLAQGLQLKNPMIRDKDQDILITSNGIGPANSPDVLQDSNLPTNLFRRTTQQADLLLGMDRILRKKEEEAFDTDEDYSATASLLFLAGQQIPFPEGGASLKPVPRYPLRNDSEMLPTALNLVTENKLKRPSPKTEETAFVLPCQGNEGDGTPGVPLGSTQHFQRTPEVIDDLALRVERILSEEPLYDMHKMNFLDRIRPKDGFFEKLSFDGTDHNSSKTETISDITENSSPPQVELHSSKISDYKCSSDLIKNQQVKEQGQHFENGKILECNAEGTCFSESVASKESSDNFQVSTFSSSSHSEGSSMKEISPEEAANSCKKDLPADSKVSCSDTKTETFGNSFAPTMASLNEEQHFSQNSTDKVNAPSEPVNLGHNETFPNAMIESANSTKFLEEDVRRCLDWSNMSTFSSPSKETVPVTPADNLYTQPEMTKPIFTEPEKKPVTTATVSNIPRNDQKGTSIISESSMTSSYVSSVSRSGSISGKSTTSSSHFDSDCHSLNTVASVCTVSEEQKLHESSKLGTNQQEKSNSHQRYDDAVSSSISSLVQTSSSRNQSQKCPANNGSTQRTEPSFSSDLRQSKNLTVDDFQQFDNNVYSSSKSNNALPKSPYKLSLSESQPDFHPKKQMPKKNANRSCSDISTLLHSKSPPPFLKPKDFATSESLRRDLDALSNYRQENDFKTPTNLERKTPKESGDATSQPNSKNFPSVSPSMIISPLSPDHDLGSQQGDSGGLKRHNRDSNSLAPQFYESSTSREFVIGKASSSSSSTNQSRNNSAQIYSQDSAVKEKKHNISGQIHSADKHLTNDDEKFKINQQAETTGHHIPKGPSCGMELNSQSPNNYPSSVHCETRETSTSSGTVTSPSDSTESVASHKTWTLRPYKPPGSREWYYTDYSEGLITGESGTTTLESADTGSDDAIGPQIPKEFLGSRVDVPSRPGIYSRLNNKKKIPVQEDLSLSTIHEKSFIDDRDRTSRTLEKRISQCFHNTNGYSVKSSTAEQGNLPIPGTRSIPVEFKTRNKELAGTFRTPQRIEHLISKENGSTQSLHQKISLRPLDVENSLTKTLYDHCEYEADNIEECRRSDCYPEKIAADRSVLDLQAKNQSSFESATTTVDTPSGFTTDPDHMSNGPRQLELSLSSADSGHLQDISGVAGLCHPMIRYAPASQWNPPRVAVTDVQKVNDQNISKPPPVYPRKPDILSQRTERVVRSSKELDLLWERFQQQDSSDHNSSLGSERLGHMHQLLKNPTHALVHHSLEKMESNRLKQAKMAAHKMEEQKRALLCSKIQDESDSVTGSIYSNRESSSSGTMRRDNGSISSRPSSTSDTLSSIAEERQVNQRQVKSQGRSEESEAGVLDPIMARLRQKIDKQRKKCEQMKMRDKASEQKLRKLTHILVNRQMNDLVLAAEMSSLSTTSTASATTASEMVPNCHRQNSCKNQPDPARKKANPVSRQLSDRILQKDNPPPRPDQKRPSQNSARHEKIRVQGGQCSKSKQVFPKSSQNRKPRANSPKIPISAQHCSGDHSPSRPKKKDAATMVPSPQVVSDETSDSEDSWEAVKTSIGIQTSPPREMLDNSRRPNFLVASQLQTNQSPKTNAIKNFGSTISPCKSASVEEVQVIPVPFMSTPKRYKNLANEALYKSSDNRGKKTSVDKGNAAWFISLSDQPTHNARQYQHHQFVNSFAGNTRATSKGNKKMDIRIQQGVSKKPAGHSHVSLSQAVVPVHHLNGFHQSPENNIKKPLAITHNRVDDVESKVTLQEAFFDRMQSWISRSRERQKRIALAAEERRYQQQMELEREEMFLSKKPSSNNTAHPFSENLHNPKKRILSKKEIRELNKRLYKKLPEVVQQKVLSNRATQYRSNRIRSRIFSMRVQKSLLTKATSR